MKRTRQCCVLAISILFLTLSPINAEQPGAKKSSRICRCFVVTIKLPSSWEPTAKVLADKYAAKLAGGETLRREWFLNSEKWRPKGYYQDEYASIWARVFSADFLETAGEKIAQDVIQRILVDIKDSNVSIELIESRSPNIMRQRLYMTKPLPPTEAEVETSAKDTAKPEKEKKPKKDKTGKKETNSGAAFEL